MEDAPQMRHQAQGQKIGRKNYNFNTENYETNNRTTIKRFAYV